MEDCLTGDFYLIILIPAPVFSKTSLPANFSGAKTITNSNHRRFFRVVCQTLLILPMKPVLKSLLLWLLIIVAGCHHAMTPEQDNPGDLTYTDDLSQAQQWFNGRWELIAVTSMIPNPPVPKVQLVVGNNQITVIQEGKQTDQVNFEMIKIATFFQIETNAQPREDNWYIRNPGLQISSNRLFLNTGGSDPSTFRFRRID
ncbi:hypothetical protein ACO2Q8_01750 [Larkinella sp. VNQ87]|uniref:hypothetical protein n=1 Tax=Larkinella sp. VNQ87 TaxID=3400921 RepID=UPI003C0E6730